VQPGERVTRAPHHARTHCLLKQPQTNRTPQDKQVDLRTISGLVKAGQLAAF
jgi:hypothetical protein